jgi:serine/threonine protein kinase/tetratricopeptide (TPR) repeat protein
MPDDHAALAAELFKNAVERDESQWPSFLDEACPDDTKLRHEVESLLRFSKQANTFLEEPARAIAESPIAEVLLGPGQALGSYRILSHLGSGGMGDVYLATDEKLGRQVALKLIRPGLTTEGILRRFRREEHILATLNHPHIAHLYGADLTPDGFSYLVMEYVEGTRVDSYCEAHRLSLRDHLLLFRKVCAAIHFAHQHLVIHRDIKPSNILVRKDGEPKLLDFGIAKLLSDDPLQAEQTISLGPMLTPDYASPEHARGEAVTTASDVYSLGVLLYQLLTGARPYRIKTNRPEEVVRAITEQEPAKPSTALQGRDSRIENRESANSRFTVHDSRSLRGDLDNIVLMALRKEPERRYASVAQFADDIRRHLEGLPVIARRDTLSYRGAKFIRRNKLGVIAAALVMLSLVAGMIATVWQARIAREQALIAMQERDRAQIEKAKAERINQFLQDTLGFADPGALAPGAGQGVKATVGDALKEAARRAETELADQPEVLAGVLRTIGTAYLDLGQFDLAERNLQHSSDLYQKIYGQENPEAVWSTVLLANVDAMKGRYAKAEPIYQKALVVFDKRSSEAIPALWRFSVLNSLGLIKISGGEPAAGERFLRDALKLSPKLSGNDRGAVAMALASLGQARVAQGDLGEAQNFYRQSIDEYRRLPGRERLETASTLTFLGDVLRITGNYPEAENALREALEISRRLAGDKSPNFGLASAGLAFLKYMEGDYVAAEQAVNKSLQIYEQFVPEGHIGPTAPMTTLGLILNKTGRSAEAESTLRKALATRERILPKGHWQIAFTKGALGECLMTQKRYAEAEPLLLESYNDLKQSQGETHPRTIEARRRIATLYEKWAKPDLAESYR